MAKESENCIEKGAHGPTRRRLDFREAKRAYCGLVLFTHSVDCFGSGRPASEKRNLNEKNRVGITSC